MGSWDGGQMMQIQYYWRYIDAAGSGRIFLAAHCWCSWLCGSVGQRPLGTWRSCMDPAPKRWGCHEKCQSAMLVEQRNIWSLFLLSQLIEVVRMSILYDQSGWGASNIEATTIKKVWILFTFPKWSDCKAHFPDSLA